MSWCVGSIVRFFLTVWTFKHTGCQIMVEEASQLLCSGTINTINLNLKSQPVSVALYINILTILTTREVLKILERC